MLAHPANRVNASELLKDRYFIKDPLPVEIQKLILETPVSDNQQLSFLVALTSVTVN
jgi:hypothetical protein